jgi:hypothetical protein
MGHGRRLPARWTGLHSAVKGRRGAYPVGLVLATHATSGVVRLPLTLSGHRSVLTETPFTSGSEHSGACWEVRGRFPRQCKSYWHQYLPLANMATKISAERLQKLQNATPHIRSICILAHVDHGKTTYVCACMLPCGRGGRLSSFAG